MAKNKPRTMSCMGYEAVSQFNHAVNSMQEDGAVGEIIVINQHGDSLVVRSVAPESLNSRMPENTLAILIDGGNTHAGQMWKIWFFPRPKLACVLVEDTGTVPGTAYLTTKTNAQTPIKTLKAEEARASATAAINTAREGQALRLVRDHSAQRLLAKDPVSLPDEVEVMLVNGYREGEGQVITLWHPALEIGFEVLVPDMEFSQEYEPA